MQQSGENKLLKKYQVGKCMPEEQAMIAPYIIYVDIRPKNLSAMLPALNQLRLATMRTHIRTGEMIWPGRVIIAAAAIAILLGIESGILSRGNNQLPPYPNKVNPGSDKAILTLGNETRINLSDARSSSLLNQLAVEIIKAEDGSLVYNVASKSNTSGYTITTTAKDGQYQFVLSDATRGWLNAPSRLFHSTSLKYDRDERKVNVLGDAYFEVYKVKSVIGRHV